MVSSSTAIRATCAQAGALDALLAELDKPIDSVVLMNVDERSLLLRLTGRRTCPVCGKVFNVYTSPSAKGDRCDNPEHGGEAPELQQRADDREDVIENRLKVYTEQTSPLIEHYENAACCGSSTPTSRWSASTPTSCAPRKAERRATASARAARRLRRAASHAATGSSPARPTHTRAPRRRAAWRVLRFRCRGCQPLRAPPP